MSNYAFEHAGRTFTPDRSPVTGSVADHNAQLEARELAAWAERPDRALMYYQFEAEYQSRRDLVAAGGINHYRSNFSPRTTGATVSTWLGTVTGKITEARVYRHNFGQRFVSLRVLGTNGAESWGRASWDGGNCVVLRKIRRCEMKRTAKPDTIATVWEVWTYDVWGNPKDGYEVNDRYWRD